MKWLSTVNFCAMIIVFMAMPAVAQTVDVTQNMSFGRVTLSNNTAQRQIAFQTNGSYTADPQYTILDNPVIAHVVVDNFPIRSRLYVTFITNPTTLNPPSGPGHFTVNNYFTIPAVVGTNNFGDAQFDVGAVLHSDGTTNPYSAASFSQNVTVRVSTAP